MKWKIILPLVLLVFLGACAATRQQAAQASLDGKWKLAVFPYQKKTLAEVFGDRVVDITFAEKDNKVAGTTGCNRFTGTYTISGDSLLFSKNRALTRMACPGYDESLFLSALDRVNRYRLIEGQLEMLDGTEIVLIFARND